MLNAHPTARTEERGVALLAAVAMLVFATFVITAIMVSARSSADLSRERIEQTTAEQLSRDAGSALTAAYSTLASGEFDGFIPSRAVLAQHAAKVGGSVVSNDTAHRVDSRVPGRGRYTVRQPLPGNRTGYWQVYSVRLPTWGSTPSGRVQVFVRVWTRNRAGIETQPAVYRLEFRPTWFADYQMLFDGPARVGPDAQIAGRVHSNGYATSYYGLLRSQAAQVLFEPGASCTATARVSTATGSISAPGSCRKRANTGIRYNFLRARDAVARMRPLCTNASLRPSVNFACPSGTGTTSIVLSGTNVIVNGRPYSARVMGDRPGDKQGAVVIANGSVTVRGTLGSNARATVFAASQSDSTSYGQYGAPSAWITSNGVVGASDIKSSSFGLVVEGDVVLDERRASNVTYRGAIVTMSGMLSSNPIWRTPVPTAGGRYGNSARVIGSIAGHFPPQMINLDNRSGYANRRYVWLKSLYDNPPPLYPTAADWELTRFEPADLDCFQKSAGGSLREDRPDCK